jgi:hypothetical protein
MFRQSRFMILCGAMPVILLAGLGFLKFARPVYVQPTPQYFQQQRRVPKRQSYQRLSCSPANTSSGVQYQHFY